MPLMRSHDGRQQRIVPGRSVGPYLARGWTVASPQADAQDDVEAPNVSDRKSDWVDYAVTRGYDPDEGLTKDELIERYG